MCEKCRAVYLEAIDDLELSARFYWDIKQMLADKARTLVQGEIRASSIEEFIQLKTELERQESVLADLQHAIHSAWIKHRDCDGSHEEHPWFDSYK